MPGFDPTCEPNNEVVGVRRFKVITGGRGGGQGPIVAETLAAGANVSAVARRFGRNRSIPGAGWRTRAFGDHGSFTFRIEGVSEFFLVELAKCLT